MLFFISSQTHGMEMLLYPYIIFVISQLFTIFSFVGSVYKTHINLSFCFWQFRVITWVIKFNYFHNQNLWFCCFDHSHAEQSCVSHVTVSLFFTRLVLVSGLHLWESYIGLMPSIALLPAHSCSPSTIHSPCPPHRLLFTSLFCYYDTWSAHTHTT